MHAKGPSHRQMMVARTIQERISIALLKGDLAHPGIRGDFISITDVKVSPDLHNATVLVAIRNDASVSIIDYMKVLNKNLSYEARNLVAKNLRTKYTPNIQFTLDKSPDGLQKLNEVFSKITE